MLRKRPEPCTTSTMSSNGFQRGTCSRAFRGSEARRRLLGFARAPVGFRTAWSASRRCGLTRRLQRKRSLAFNHRRALLHLCATVSAWSDRRSDTPPHGRNAEGEPRLVPPGHHARPIEACRTHRHAPQRFRCANQARSGGGAVLVRSATGRVAGVLVRRRSGAALRQDTTACPQLLPWARLAMSVADSARL